MRPPTRQLPLRWLGAGAALALCLHPWPPAPREREVRWWVSDRGAQAVVGLDRELFVAASVPWPWPVGLEVAPGGLWVLAASEGHAGGGHRLSRVRVDRGAWAEVGALELDRVLDLAAAPDGGVLWLERPAAQAARLRLGRLDRADRARAIEAPAGSTCLAAAPAGVLVGTEGGATWLLRAGRGSARWARGPGAGGSTLDVLAGAEGGWWVLAESAAGLELSALGPDLALRFSMPLAGAGGRLAAGAGGVLVATDGAGARGLWVGQDGAVRSIGALPLRGVRAVLATGGGALIACPGALLRWGPDGRALPGQGGFDHLSDLAPAGRR